MKKQLATKFQEQFWIINRISPRNAAYNIPVVFKLNAMPKIDILENAINQIVQKYDVLRSEYSLMSEGVIMNFVEPRDLTIKVNHEKSLPETIDSALPREIYQEIEAPFDLSEAPLFRVKLFSFADKSIFLTFVFHHIIIDLRSKEIFFKYLEKLYNSNLINNSDQEMAIAKQYGDFAKEHNSWLSGDEAKKMIQLWKDELPPVNYLLNLPITYPRSKTANFNGKRRYFTISENTAELIRKFSTDKSINTFTFCLSAYVILMNKLSNQNKIVIGVPLSNRRDSGNSNVFGCLVNIVPIVIDFQVNSNTEEIIKQVRNKLLYAHRKQEVPFLSLLETEKERRNLAYNPYFQTGFTFEPLSELKLDDISLQPTPVEKEGAQLDIFLTMWETEDEFCGYVEYSTRLFSDCMAQRIEETYKKIITEILSKKNKINELIVLPENDKALLYQWNNTFKEVNTNKCLHTQFEEQVIQTPNNIALRFNSSFLTYSELNAHSNRLAHFLVNSQIKVEDIVGISLSRSFELIVAILAIHKAGAAYLPLDSKYPVERIKPIVEDGDPKLILTTSQNAANLKGFSQLVFIDDMLTNPLSDNDSNPNIEVSSSNLAYVLFTSGSTGRPKGVMIEHHSVINKLVWMQHKHPISKEESLLLKTPITFDVSVWELFWWFFGGSSLTILRPEAEKDPGAIIRAVSENQVSTLIFVPSMFAPFTEYLKLKNEIRNLVKLKYIILIGEVVTPQLVMNFNKLRTEEFSPKLVNTYGPTEATVAVSYYDCPEESSVNEVFIGKPIFNTKLYIINSHTNICPIGVSGELVIAGENLARGYKNRPELNEDKFIVIKNPEGKNEKVYKTGDLAKWAENGELDFICRIDNQVKIRGYRIELGDIESKLQNIDEVEISAVTINEPNEGNKQLIAYVVLKGGSTIGTDGIKKFLKKKLPEYMVPTHIIFLDKMPLNSSEKIDRKALPKPVLCNSINFTKATSKTERILAEIFSELLCHENIDIAINFFDLGGDSLMVINMVAQVKKRLDIDIEPVDIMQYPNIRELSEYLDNIKLKNGDADKYNKIIEKAKLRRTENPFRKSRKP